MFFTRPCLPHHRGRQPYPGRPQHQLEVGRHLQAGEVGSPKLISKNIPQPIFAPCRYVVIYVRNDTGKPTSIETREPRVTLQKLHPGAGYEIKVRC